MAFNHIDSLDFDVEHASSLYVYENLMGEVQHINGKGVTDTYTKVDDIRSVNAIDVVRLKPLPPMFRQVGSPNNGGWHNKKNEGGFNNATQSEHYTIGVDLIYDRNVVLMATQEYSTKVALASHIQAGVVNSIGLSINVVTHAKQLEGYFRDSFKHTSDMVGDAQADEIEVAVFPADKNLQANVAGSYPDAFIAANAQLNEGCADIGAFYIPVDERQAFVSNTFNRICKRQYQQNASEASARILATGYMNPFNGSESARIKMSTGLCGMYDGVDLFIVNDAIKRFVYIALGLDPDVDTAEIALLKKIQAVIVYAGSTMRGIVGPTIKVKEHPFEDGIIIVPRLKMGCEVIKNGGKAIKVVVEGGWSAGEINSIIAKLKFTPIDGVTVTGDNAFAKGIFNDGTSN